VAGGQTKTVTANAPEPAAPETDPLSGEASGDEE